MTLFKPTPDDLDIKAQITPIKPGHYLPVTEHFHEFYEIYYLKEGYRRYLLRDRFFDIGPRCLTAIPPFSLHKTSSGDGYRGGYVKMQALASPAFINGLDRKGELDPLLLFFAETYPIYRLSSDAARSWEEGLAELVRWDGDGGHKAIREALYRALILKLAYLYREGEILPVDDRPSSSHPSPVQIMAAHISGNYRKRENLESLAALAGLHPKYACRIFKEEMGLTTAQYRNLQRVNRAQELLMGTEDSLEMIACKAGFGGLTQMGRVFKSFRGVSPSRWRRDRGGALRQSLSSGKVI